MMSSVEDIPAYPIYSDLQGKCIVVTGAGKGIGRDLALCLQNIQKSQVVAISRTSADLESLAEEAPGIQCFCCDVTDWSAVENIFSTYLNDKLIYGLVNNAGIMRKEPFTSLTEECLKAVIDTNLISAFHIGQLCAKNMIQNETNGSIVIVSSLSGMYAHRNLCSYCCSKAALDMLASCMSLELGKDKIRVNSINPTVVMTNMAKQNIPSLEAYKYLLSLRPQGRFPDIHEVIRSIIFLLSNQASPMVTGQHLSING